MLHRVEEGKSYLTSIGAFSGWGGILYVLAHLGALWHKPDLLSGAESLVGLTRGLIERDEQLDIVAGAVVEPRVVDTSIGPCGIAKPRMGRNVIDSLAADID